MQGGPWLLSSWDPCTLLLLEGAWVLGVGSHPGRDWDHPE